MLDAIMTAAVQKSIRAGATVLTASARLAHALRLEAEQEQRRQGGGCWRTPDILPWGQWLERCWRQRLQQGGETRLLLRAAQEQVVWRELIEPAAGAPGLLDVEATCRNAMQAWSLVCEWNLDLDAEEWHSSQDAETFRTWALQFRRLCHERGWVPAARLPEVVAEWLLDDPAGLPRHPLALAGFDELTPAQQRVLAALREAGATVEIAPVDGEPAERAGWVPLRNSEDEILQAARWARARVEEESGGAIGIIIPDLTSSRAQVERIFTDVFHPEDELETPRTGWRAFNLSMGLPLAEYPVVQGALLLLDAVRATLQGRALSAEEVGRLLRSPWLSGAESERTERARLDARLREQQEMEIPVRQLARAARGSLPACPRLATALDRLLAWCGDVPKRQSFTAWAEEIRTLLEELGWPGDRPLDSAEHQTRQAFLDLLAELDRLDQVSGEAPCVVALAHLRRMLAHAVFQPESVTAPVQVMGLLESSGLRFRHLRVLGLHDGVWPAAARPHPFLPLALQRRYNLPHSSAAREFAFARRRMQLLLAAAPQVIFSVPQRDGDTELHPSPLVTALGPWEDNGPAPESLPRPAERLRGTAQLEQIEDHVAPPVEDGEAARGGSGIFSRQAACPFQAFAVHRLFAEPLETPAPGLDPRQRGLLLHEAMELVWRQLGDHAGLTAFNDEALRQPVEAAVAQAIEAHQMEFPGLRRPRLRAIERDCLTRLLMEWMAVERLRPPFRVLQQERERQVEFAGLSLRLRADRIDELPDGRRILLDYKTGEHHPREWLGARPEQPQLPLYAVAADTPPAALAFARLRTGKTGFHGLSAEAGLLPGVGPSDDVPWEQQMDEWRAELDRLATEFRSGWALADPRDGAETCRTCELTALCRINEARAVRVEPAGEGDAS